VSEILHDRPNGADRPTGADRLEQDLREHIATAVAARHLLPAVQGVARMLCAAFERGGILYTFGNGGSAADAQHLTGEIIGHFRRERRPLGSVTLSTNPTALTCIANDYAFDDVFARQVSGLVRPGDVVAAFTTSGRSPDIVRGLEAARERGATTVLFGGGDGGPAARFADHVLLAPSTSVPRIQELHTFLLHAVSEHVDAWAAGDGEGA
jgi:D-sedoheptulose 7-phosphate isomerase